MKILVFVLQFFFTIIYKIGEQFHTGDRWYLVINLELWIPIF
jgi:hypothetical protein